jgi:AraC-like DNA-binding protein
MIRFGAWSILLLVLAAQALVLAVALVRQRQNRLSNRYLAALLVVLAGMLTPFVIGYAGFYDAWPWLSFAPFAIPLAVGPLLYGHIHALVAGRGISPVNFALPAAHLLYQSICFLMPLDVKDAIDAGFQRPFLEPVLSVAILASMGGYAALGYQLARRYAGWARGRAAAEARAAWLKRTLAALLLLLAARAAFEAYDALVARLDYFDLFGFYVLLAIVGVFLGVEGWRHASSPFPPLPAAPDLTALAERALQVLAEAQYWRDPDLSLAALSRHLGTNETYLSRALNQGGGSGFADLVNRLRAEEVARRLAAGDRGDLLTIALESGFGSKASFNRAFRARFGLSPSAWRDAQASDGAFPDASAI